MCSSGRRARNARAAGLAGWVRNTEGGEVEAVFEGHDAAVASIVSWCREGPSLARVDEVAIREEPVVGEDGFRVTR